MTRGRGFSLVEMAVVMVIVGLLIGGLLAPLATQIDARNYADTQKRIEYAREELLGFVISNGRLPCPASSTSNGDESPTWVSGVAAACDNYYDGYLPAKVLGVQQVDKDGYAVDAYNNRIRYVLAKKTYVSPSGSECPTTSSAFHEYANIRSNGLQCLPGDLLVCKSSTGISSTSCGSTTNSLIDQYRVVAIIFSQGKNAATSDSTRLDELANTNGDPAFVYHLPTPSEATGGEFDDQMVWISAGMLYGRMVSAGLMP